MGHYVPEGTGEGLCDLSQAGSNIPEGTGAGLCDLTQAGSNKLLREGFSKLLDLCRGQDGTIQSELLPWHSRGNQLARDYPV